METYRLCSQVGFALALGLAATATAEPMDLGDAHPRWVAVRFERSPPYASATTESAYTPPFAAWLEPGEQAGEVVVTVGAAIVETVLLADYGPVPGSFSDFVWKFDADTGHVGSARIEGTIRRVLGFGATLEAPLKVRMDTRREAGFGALRSLLGLRYRSYCIEAGSDCTLVRPYAYDRASGYVNAVGEILAHAGPLRVRSYSPLGEAIFSELPRDASDAPTPTPRVQVTAPPPLDDGSRVLR